jgi:ribosomal protein L40E
MLNRYIGGESMTLKDNLSKIAKSVGSGAANVAKKSGSVMGITKLNINIQSEEDKIRALHSQIGVIIYSKYKNQENIDTDLVTICKKIQEHQGRVKELNEKILNIKKVKLCEKCENELELEATFCEKCGFKQNK